MQLCILPLAQAIGSLSFSAGIYDSDPDKAEFGFELHRDSGKESGSYRDYRGYIGIIGLYRDNGKENGSSGFSLPQ